MLRDRSFRIALTISLILHTSLFFKLPHLNLLPLRQPIDHVEVNYIEEKLLSQKTESLSQKLPQVTSYRVSIKRINPPPYIEKEQIFRENKNFPIKKPNFLKPEIMAMKKKITLPALNSQKINNPVYLNYYQIIREKIKQAAYQNYNRPLNGQVYLSFVLLRDGKLKELKIKETKMPTDPYLKKVAEKSILDASPFPEFPKELDFSELSFNVIISFRVE